jgi:vacuolar-type H+-ATPase subunit F/Vma7
VIDEIAVIGRTDSIDFFRVLGCKTFIINENELTGDRMDEILNQGFKIILVTEEIYQKEHELIRGKTEGIYPVVSVIPDVLGSQWTERKPRSRRVAFNEMREMVIRAVGQDISGTNNKNREKEE